MGRSINAEIGFLCSSLCERMEFQHSLSSLSSWPWSKRLSRVDTVVRVGSFGKLSEICCEEETCRKFSKNRRRRRKFPITLKCWGEELKVCSGFYDDWHCHRDGFVCGFKHNYHRSSSSKDRNLESSWINFAFQLELKKKFSLLFAAATQMLSQANLIIIAMALTNERWREMSIHLKALQEITLA